MQIQDFDKVEQFNCSQHLNGVPVVAGTFSSEYFESLRYNLVKDASGNVRLGSGFGVEIYRYFQDSYNFKEKAVNGTPIGIGGDGKLTGLGAQLVSGSINISILSSTFVAYRLKELSLLHPTYYEFVRATFIQPDVNGIRNIHTTAFSGNMWLSLISVWAAILVAITIATQVLHVLKWAWTDTLFWGLTVLTSQDSATFPKLNTVKIIVLFTLFMNTVIYTAYCAILTALLSGVTVPVKTIEDLVTFNYDIYFDNFSPDARDSVQELQRNGKIPTKEREMTVPAAIQKVTHGRIAFFNIYSDGLVPEIRLHYEGSEACKLFSRIVVSRRPVLHSVAVSKSSRELKECFNRKIIKMYETGFRFRYITNYQRKHSLRCLQGTHTKPPPFSINEVLIILILYLIGSLASFVVLVFEMQSRPRLGFLSNKINRIVGRLWTDNARNNRF